MKRVVLILSFAWAAVATATYFAGRHHGEPQGAALAESATSAAPVLVGKAPVPAQAAPGAMAPEAEPGAARLAVVSDATGNAFIDGLLAAGSPVSGEDIERGIREAYDDDDPVKSNLLFARLLTLVTPENAEAAMQSLRELPRGFELYQQMALVQFSWGKQDGAAAAEYTLNLEGRSREYSISKVMEGWAAGNPQEAIAYANQLDDGGDRSRVLGGIIRGLAESSPAMATALAVDAIADGDKRGREFIDSIAREQFRGGIDKAEAWVSTVPAENGLREGALERVARSYVSQDPAAAAQWIQNFAGSGYGERAIGEVADEWAERDPAAAIDWVGTLPPGDERQRAYREAMSEWTSRDPFAAAEYLAEMNAGEDRDAAITSLSKRHVSRDPEAAIAWAQTIGNPELRVNTLTATGQHWMKRDPQAATDWLLSSGLPPAVVQKIANPPSDGKR